MKKTPASEEAIFDKNLEEEDKQWETSMARHADQFAALLAQAKTEIQAGQTTPMFNKQGEFVYWAQISNALF